MKWKLQVENPRCSTSDLGVLIGWHNQRFVKVRWNGGFDRLEMVEHLRIAGYQPAEPADECAQWDDPLPVTYQQLAGGAQ